MTQVCRELPWMGSALSHLQLHAVCPATARAYADHILMFSQWAQDAGLLLTLATLDILLVKFFDIEYLAGTAPYVGSELLAAILHFWPSLGLSISTAFPQATRALKGWHKLVPARTRQPLPLLALFALVGRLLATQNIAAAICLLIGFSAYLRPRELTSLKVKQLVPPQRYGGAHHRHWALVLHSQEAEIRSKTGRFDESIVLDGPLMAGIEPLLSALVADRPHADRLWPFSHAELLARYQTCIRECRLGALETSLYALRHGGASHDTLHKLRSIEQVRDRGRWASTSSLLRYQKTSRAQAELAKIPSRTRHFAELVLARLPEVFNEPKLATVWWAQFA